MSSFSCLSPHFPPLHACACFGDAHQDSRSIQLPPCLHPSSFCPQYPTPQAPAPAHNPPHSSSSYLSSSSVLYSMCILVLSRDRWYREGLKTLSYQPKGQRLRLQMSSVGGHKMKQPLIGATPTQYRQLYVFIIWSAFGRLLLSKITR